MNWTLRCAALLFLLHASLAAAQLTPVLECSITIQQPTAVSYSTTIVCDGDDNPDLFVVVQNATQINNAATYTLNGEAYFACTDGTTACLCVQLPMRFCMCRSGADAQHRWHWQFR